MKLSIPTLLFSALIIASLLVCQANATDTSSNNTAGNNTNTTPTQKNTDINESSTSEDTPISYTSNNTTTSNNSTISDKSSTNSSPKPETSLDVETNAITESDALKLAGPPDNTYNIIIDIKVMCFEYDYGYTWNPTTHSYSPGSTGLQHGGWNVEEYLDGEKNRITITNYSTFPVQTTLKYENNYAFNEEVTSSSVSGIFNANNDELKDVVRLNNIDTQTIADTTLTLSGNGGNNTLFFSLIGKPDNNINKTDKDILFMKDVGKVSIKIDKI